MTRGRWRLRFGVRTLLLMTAMFAVALGWDLRRSREIRPPDLIVVDVPSVPPGRPISGDRLVRPDGRITLGYYGNVHVAGLTAREAKAKIVAHLRDYRPNEPLGSVSVRVSTKNATSGFIGWVMRDVCRRYDFGRD